MDQFDYDRLIRKYRGTRTDISMDIVTDARMMLQHIEAQTGLIRRLRTELAGLMTSLMAICKAIGTIEVPYDLAESVQPGDHLMVADLKNEHGCMKRFSYRAKDDPSAPRPDQQIYEPPTLPPDTIIH